MNFQYKNIMKENSIALYIHVPFCKQKCLYCDFPSFSGKEQFMLEYSQVLAKDIESIGKRRVKTIFIGGGTPTYLSLEDWSNIAKAIEKLNLEEDIEFSVEGNPGTFTEEKLSFLKNMGVNRLSIGLQAWQSNMLKKIGRIHTVEDFLRGYKLARKIGFSNINIDLMFGLPDQSLEDWKETLENVVNLEPEHISCYSLIIEKGTAFYKMFHDEKLNIPGEEEERKMYQFALEFLNKRGYYQYEISNFSKKNNECRHNLVYWNLEEYIGCGVGSHSYVDGFRYRKTENIEEYIREGKYEEISRLDEHKNSTKENMEEFMFMGLRKTKGVSVVNFKEKFKKDIYSIYGDVINKHVKDGTIIEKNNRIYLSVRGIEISNNIMCDFLLE